MLNSKTATEFFFFLLLPTTKGGTRKKCSISHGGEMHLVPMHLGFLLKYGPTMPSRAPNAFCFSRPMHLDLLIRYS